MKAVFKLTKCNITGGGGPGDDDSDDDSHDDDGQSGRNNQANQDADDNTHNTPPINRYTYFRTNDVYNGMRRFEAAMHYNPSDFVKVGLQS